MPRFHSNQKDESLVARREELAALTREAMGFVARQILVTLPPNQRSSDESDFLQDVARGRRDFGNLAMLLALESRSALPHRVSEAIRAREISLSAKSLCRQEANLLEESSNAPLNQAQLLAEREDTPTRWQQVVEFAQRQMYATRQLLDAAYSHLNRVGA